VIGFVRNEVPERGDAVLDDLQEGRIEEPELAVEALERLKDALEVLMQYRYFVPVKTARAIGGLDRLPAEDVSPDDEDFQFCDALGTAKLVHECLGKSAAALWQVAEFHRSWMDVAMPVALETESLRLQLVKTFPRALAFRRPGLDDPR
jgi:hypothetical protein